MSEGTAQRILVAADEVLAEAGYDGASVRAVAERAGVNKALVFYHFENKSALFDRVLEHYYERQLQALRDAFEREGTVRERLHRLLDAYVTFMHENRRYPRLVQQILAGASDKQPVIARNLFALYRWTREALGALTPAEGPLAARQFFLTFSALVTGYFTYAPVLAPLWDEHEDPLSEEALAERRDHLHWVMDRMIDGLEQAKAPQNSD